MAGTPGPAAEVQVAIIGGGLAGLCAARLLHAASVGFRLVEGRDRLGGRIFGADGFDLGPFWFWPEMNPEMAALLGIADGIEALEAQVEDVEAAILARHKSNEASRRLASVPGIGPITATAIVATVGDVSNFRSARHLAAWIGLVPKQDSTGDKP